MTIDGDALLISLDDDRALEGAVVGAKAAALATARRAGLPVLPGFAVTVSAGRDAVAVGAEALQSHNSGYARARVIAFEPDAALTSAIGARAADLGEPLVVRSSATTESDGPWAGAFASYAELAADEVVNGVKGCWSSLFGVDAVERAAASGFEPDAVGMAVLVQPELIPSHGGVASIDPNGAVTVTAIAGSPAAIVSGWERGEVVVVARGESAASRPHAGSIDPSLFDRVARLAVDTFESVSYNHIEWAIADGELWLFQAQRSFPAAPSPVASAPYGPVTDPAMIPVARALAAYPGPVGDRFVLSWALGSSLPEPVPLDAPVADLYRRAVRLSDSLRAARWFGAEEAIRDQAVRRLGGTDPESALEVLAPLPPVDEEQAATLLGVLQALAGRLGSEGRIPRPNWMWHLGEDVLEDLVAGRLDRFDPARRVGVSRFEPLLFKVAAGAGASVSGVAASPGWGAGPLRFVRDADDALAVRPRDVVAAVYPLTNLAPLLWDAAGLITIGGSPGAHVFEVASWLGVPALCGVDLETATGLDLEELRTRRGILAALEADAGTAWIVP